MRKTTKIWLVIAASLVLVGCIIWGGVMSVLKWDLTKLSTVKLETNEYEISEKFSNISVETDTAGIIFALSDDGKCRVECHEERKAKHSVTVEGDTLVIKMLNEKSWYDYIGINFGSPKITVYLPKAEYTALSIKTSTGEIHVENVSAKTLDLSVSTGKITVSNVICRGDITINVSTGKIKLDNVKCKNLLSKGSTGNISLHHVIATEKFTIKRSTGNVKFDSSDAAEILVKTNTGNVTGTFLSEKIFIAETDTGSINVPKSITGGRCEITTDTGRIQLEIQ